MTSDSRPLEESLSVPVVDQPAELPSSEATIVNVERDQDDALDVGSSSKSQSGLPLSSSDDAPVKASTPGAVAVAAELEKGNVDWREAEMEEEFVLPKNNLPLVSVSLAMVLFLAALDQTAVSTALPIIAQDLNGSGSLYSWVGVSYLLSQTALMPVYGKASDLFGRKPILYGCIIIFLGASALCGAAQNMIWLIVCRAIQGIGGGGILNLVNTVMSDLVSLKDRGKWSGYLGTTFGLASVLGPLIGGAFADQVGWRWIFWFNLPTGGVAIVMLFLTLRLNPTKKRSAREMAANFDWIGLFMLMGGTILILLGLTWSTSYSWTTPATLGMLVSGLVLFGLAIVHEFYTKLDPIIPPRLFKTRTTSFLLFGVLVHGITFFSAAYYLPVFFQAVMDSNALMSGIRTFPLSLLAGIMSVIAGQFITRVGLTRPVSWACFSISTLGFALMATLDENSSVAKQEIYILIAGIGVGMYWQPPLVAIQAAMPLSAMASVTSAFFLIRMLGSTIGLAIGGTVMNSQLAQNLPPQFASLINSNVDYPSLWNIQPDSLRQEVLHAFARAISTIWIVAASIMFVAFILTLFVKEYSLNRNYVKAKTAAATPGEVAGTSGEAEVTEEQAKREADAAGGAIA